MYDHANQSLGPPLQEYRIRIYLATRRPIRCLKIAKMCQKLLTLTIFGHVFAIFRYIRCPLVVKLLRILVEEVISFKISGVTSKLDEY